MHWSHKEMTLIVYHIAVAPFIIAIYKLPYDFCKHDLVIWCQTATKPSTTVINWLCIWMHANNCLTKCTHKTPNQMLQRGLVSAWLQTVLRTNVPIYIPAPYTGHNGLKCEDERIYLYCNSSHSAQKKKPGIIHYLLSQTAYIQSIHCRAKLRIN